MELNLDALRATIRTMPDVELLDAVTVYRPTMEAVAVALMHAELEARGFTEEDCLAHDEKRRQTGVVEPDGSLRKCTFCRTPAIGIGRHWHRLFGVVPLFPRLVAYCPDHDPR